MNKANRFEIILADDSAFVFTGVLVGKALGRFHPKSPSDSWCDLFLYKATDGRLVCNVVNNIVKDFAEGVTVLNKTKTVYNLEEAKLFFGDSWLTDELYLSIDYDLL